jgi:CBS-domain-containing membrane protein
MTTEVICCRPDTEVDEARSIMMHRRIRHLPILDDAERLCGLVSIGDLNAYEIRDHQSTISVLEQYIYGRT